MLEKLKGNRALKEDIAAALAAKKLPHSILLCGEAGVGKSFAARLIAADYLYPAGGAAAERVIKGICEDCITLQREGPGGFIKADPARSARRRAGESAFMTDGRVVLIKDAQYLHPTAANVLLKTMEEPPEGVVFILTTDSEASILPTIRSRCAVYTLSPLSVREVAATLAQNGVSVANAKLLCSVYGGRLGCCLKSSQKERLAQLADAVKFASAAAAKDSYAMLCITAFLINKKDRQSIAVFLQDTADVLSAVLSGTEVPGVKADMAAAARCLAPVNAALIELAANANQKLLVTLLCARCAGQSVALST